MDSQWKEALQNPPKAYRPVPFWSWNDRLESEETRRQIKEMDEQGMGGFFMHVRTGLETPYMNEDFMHCIRACVEKAKSNQMLAYLYDEDRWPSGAAGGLGFALRTYLHAELLSGVAITDEASLRAAADALLATGLHRVFISLGGDGVFAADRSGERVHLPVLPAEMVNTTGCGDAFMAAITWAYLAGTDLTGTAKAGLAASAIAMEGAETINPAMSAEALKLRAGL